MGMEPWKMGVSCRCHLYIESTDSDIVALLVQERYKDSIDESHCAEE